MLVINNEARNDRLMGLVQNLIGGRDKARRRAHPVADQGRMLRGVIRSMLMHRGMRRHSDRHKAGEKQINQRERKGCFSDM